MKKLIVLALAFLLICPAQAKSLREMWVSMPDSILPTLNRNLRTEFYELADMNVQPEVRNLLGEDCVMDTITSHYLHLTLSEVSTFEMMALPLAAKADTVYCFVKTFAAPEKDSEIKFVDLNWKELDCHAFFAGTFLEGMEQRLVHKPDTMSEQRYHELVSLLEPKMWFAELSANDETITFTHSLPLLSQDEKNELKTVLLQRKFKWNGKTFNEN